MNFDQAFDKLIGHEGGYVNDPLLEALELAVKIAKENAALIFSDPKNSRNHHCSIDGCKRLAYAGDLCNAHYIRKRNNKPMNEPIRARKRFDACALCGEKTSSKGGWGLCAKHYREARYRVIKDALIAAMGGACSKCGGKFHRAVYDFHHKHGKLESPSEMLKNKSIKEIAKELSKCVLLCANCHRMEHYNDI